MLSTSIRTITTSILLIALLCQRASLAGDSLTQPLQPPRLQVQDFSLPGGDGTPVTLSRDPTVELHVLCFLGTECPMARVYGPRLQQMADTFRDQGVEFIGVVSNVQDSMDEVRQYVREYGI